MTTPITKLETKGAGTESQSFDLGATFENIYLNKDDDYTLNDLYEQLNEYFDKDMFMLYSNKEPAADNVKVWYDTNPQST